MNDVVKKKNWIPFAAVGLIVLLVLLLLRESEGRFSAQATLKDFQQKMIALNAEKSTAVMNLEAENTELQGDLQDAAARYAALETDKKAEAERYEAQLRDAVEQLQKLTEEKNAEIADWQGKLKLESEKLGAVIKEKSSEISELGARLEKASADFAVLLNKKEALQNQSLQQEKLISELKLDVQRHEAEKAKISEIVQKSGEAQEAHEEASPPPGTVLD